MPKYRFHCPRCDETVEKYTSVTTEHLPCKKCEEQMDRLLPNIGSKKVTETVDTFLNVRHEEDHKKQLEDRRTTYFWEVEVPRLVQTYSVETCLQEGWLMYNEKGELVVGKRPPQKKG
jgi:hypothetical protein